MYELIALLSTFGMLYILFAGRIERSWVSGPMIFVSFGLLIGPTGMQVISLDSNPELLRYLAELTLALVLFTDAASADLDVLCRFRALPNRLLGIGLPLTILLGFAIGWMFFPDWPLLEIALLATILAPTDAALGKSVIANQNVPKPIRQALNAESGLNDGICVPVIFLFLHLIAGESEGYSPVQIGVHLFLEEVGIGILVAVCVNIVAVWIAKRSRQSGWLSPDWSTVLVVAVAYTCFGLAQWFGGSGFIASFVGGLLFGWLYQPHHTEHIESAEGIGNSLSLLTWVLFGATVVSQLIGHLDYKIVGYSLLSLTVIRMLPAVSSLFGQGLTTEKKLFMGWFGPRGLASIVFVIIVATGDAEITQRNTITLVVACTVTLSVLLHGITANPWANRIGRTEATDQ